MPADRRMLESNRSCEIKRSLRRFLTRGRPAARQAWERLRKRGHFSFPLFAVRARSACARDLLPTVGRGLSFFPNAHIEPAFLAQPRSTTASRRRDDDPASERTGCTTSRGQRESQEKPAKNGADLRCADTTREAVGRRESLRRRCGRTTRAIGRRDGNPLLARLLEIRQSNPQGRDGMPLRVAFAGPAADAVGGPRSVDTARAVSGRHDTRGIADGKPIRRGDCAGTPRLCRLAACCRRGRAAGAAARARQHGLELCREDHGQDGDARNEISEATHGLVGGLFRAFRKRQTWRLLWMEFRPAVGEPIGLEFKPRQRAAGHDLDIHPDPEQ